MDSTEQTFDSIVAQLRPIGTTPPRWRRAARTAGEFLLYLLALAILAGLLGVFGAVARIGWDMAGGVGW